MNISCRQNFSSYDTGIPVVSLPSSGLDMAVPFMASSLHQADLGTAELANGGMEESRKGNLHRDKLSLPPQQC